MRTDAIISTLLTVTIAGIVAPAAHAARQPPPRYAAAKPKVAKATAAHGPVPRGHTLQFRPARGAAAQDAARLGALVGNGCTGRANLERADHKWIVLCSNGKTFVVEQPAPQKAAAPPVECSLAGTGPEPACFP